MLAEVLAPAEASAPRQAVLALVEALAPPTDLVPAEASALRQAVLALVVPAPSGAVLERVLAQAARSAATTTAVALVVATRLVAFSRCLFLYLYNKSIGILYIFLLW